MSILVLGATGTVGSVLVSSLLARGEHVIAGVRSPEKLAPQAGLAARRFDYADPATFAPALAGVDRLFLLSPPGHADAYALVAPFLDVALPLVKKVVLMTASGVEYNDEIPLRKLELRVQASGVRHVLLRPTWFSDNFHTFWYAPISQAGVIPLPAADARTAFIDARDIAESAAAALTSDAFDGQAVTLTGPEALTYGEAAELLSQVSPRPIRYTPIDDESFRASLVQAGLPADYAGLLTGLFGLPVATQR